MSGHPKVLFVEDDSRLRDLRLEELRPTGAEVEGVAGDEAPAQIRRSQPDVVIIGETVPRWRAELFWQRHFHPAIPFVLIRPCAPVIDAWCIESEADYWGVRILNLPELFELIPGLKQNERRQTGSKNKPVVGLHTESRKPSRPVETLRETASFPVSPQASPQARRAPMLGFSGYDTLALIGAGGFGAVYLARNQVSGKLFAIKAI